MPSLILEKSADTKVEVRCDALATTEKHHFDMYNDRRSTSTNLRVALSAMADVILDTDPYGRDGVMPRLRKYIGSLAPRPRFKRGGFNDMEYLYADTQGAQALKYAFQDAKRAEPVEIFGNQLDCRDFVAMVTYVLTQTALYSPGSESDIEDPRLMFVDEVRANQQTRSALQCEVDELME